MDAEGKSNGPARIHVLHLEDNALDGELVAEFLRSGGIDCNIDRVWTREEFVRAIEAGSVDLILADHQLPTFNGDDALDVARGLAPEVPFIFVSGTLGEDIAVEALRRGATDYVVKQRLHRLPAVAVRAITESRERHQRKNAEDALRTNEREFQFALSAGRMGAWTVDFSSNTLKTSELFRSIFGRDPKLHFSYDDLTQAIHVDDRERMAAAVARSLETGEDYDIEYRVIAPSGEVRWIGIRGQPMSSGLSKSRLMSGVSVDITERRKSDDRRLALIELTDRFRALDSAEDIAYAAAEIMGRTLDANRAGFGAIDPIAETITIDRDWNAPGVRSIAGVLHFRDYGTYIDDLKRGETVVCTDTTLDERTRATADALRGIDVMSFVNMPLIERGFVALCFLNHARPRQWTDDELAFIRDVAERTRIATERRRAERHYMELAASLEQQVAQRTAERDRAWKNSRDLLTVLGADGIFLAANPAWTAILGYSPADVIGRRFDELVWADDTDTTRGALADAVSANDLTNFVNRYRHKDGSIRWISWHTSLEGDLVYAYGRDVTAEREQADALAAAQDALRQAQKLEAMGQLTGGVAHDFNNLLTPILGSLDMLHRRGIGSPREQRLIDGALQSAERAKTLIQRLLAFARRQPLQPSAVDVGSLVAGMADLVASTSGPQVRVVVHLAEDLPAAKGDPNQLEMAILNLSVNARDAMPLGGTLTVSAVSDRIGRGHRTGLMPGPYVRLSVADTGSGMDEATLQRAIEPFFSTKGIGKGTGLGLSMVHGLAAQLGGALAISSKPGLGTNVELWLPLSELAVQDAPRPDGGEMPLEAVGRALLVDDEDMVRMATADMLMEIGYHVREAGSAEEALRMIDGGETLDLLVTDHLMPGMTGADLARAFQNKRPGKPALIVSGFAEAEGIAPDLPRLTKPFRQAELARVLESIMKQPQV